MNMTPDEQQNAIGAQIVADLKATLGSAWDSVTEADRQTIADCAADAAGLQVAALAADTDEKRAAVAREKKFVDAALANVQAAGSAVVSNVFWAAFDRVTSRGLTALGVLIKAAV